MSAVVDAAMNVVLASRLLRFFRGEASTLRAVLTLWAPTYRRIDIALAALDESAEIPEETHRIRDAILLLVSAEVEAFEERFTRIITITQRSGGWAGYEDVRRILDAAGIAEGLTPPRVEQFLTAIRPGTPLRGVLDAYPQRISRLVEREIVAGLAEGRGVAAVTARVRATIGPDAMSPHLRTLIRTEMYTAYRGVQREVYAELEEKGIVEGYQWHAALAPGTCGACLAMHGRVFDEYPTLFHPNCRCRVVPVFSPKRVPSGPQRVESGAAWLARQDARTQRLALGSRERVDAFRDGGDLDGMVGVATDRAWGDSVRLVRPGSGGSVPGRPSWRR